MSDNEIDNELLALADDDSASEQEDEAKPTSPPREPKHSSSPRRSASHTPQKSPAPSQPGKNVARETNKIMTPPSSLKRKRGGPGNKSDVESQTSPAPPSPNSDASQSMSESEPDSDTSPNIITNQQSGYTVEGLYRSLEEKEHIQSLPEIQREQIIAERAQEMAEMRQNAHLKELIAARDKSREQTVQEGRGKNKRKMGAREDSADQPRQVNGARGKNSEKLEAYKRQREERDEQRRRAAAPNNSASAKSSPSDDNDERGFDNKTRTPFDSHHNNKDSTIRRDTSGEPVQYETLLDCSARRVNLSSFMWDDIVETLFLDFHVRIYVGEDRGEKQYRLAQIKKIEHRPNAPFKIAHQDNYLKWSDLYLLLAHGSHEKWLPLSSCSDQIIRHREFERWVKQMNYDKIELPRQSDMESLDREITSRFQVIEWTDQRINKKLANEKEFYDKINHIAEREELKKKRQRLIEKGVEESEILKIDQELAAFGPIKATTHNDLNGYLPDQSKPKTSESSSVVKGPMSLEEKMNSLSERNRKANAMEIRKAEIEEKKRQHRLQRAIREGKAVPDPYARNKTHIRTFYDAKTYLKSPQEEKKRKSEDEDLFGENVTTKKTANGNKKRKVDDDVIGASEFGLEIDI